MDYKWLNKDYDKTLKIKGIANLPYYSKQAFRKKYPNNAFQIIGGLGIGMHKKIGSFEMDEEILDYYALDYQKNKYHIIGYVCVGENQYIAIIKRNKYKLLIASCLLLALLSICVCLWFFQGKDKLNIDTGAKDYTPPANLNLPTDPDHITVPGFSSIKMEANTNKIYMALWNPDTNPCYFKYTIVLQDSEETIYTSQLVPPGKAITEVALSQSMEKGSYHIKFLIDTFSLKDGETPLNGSVVNSVLQVIEK